MEPGRAHHPGRQLFRQGYAAPERGLEENVVEVSGRDGLPAGTLYLENQKLYQLVRTGRDYEGFINETYYEKYRDIVDNYFDSRLEEVKDAGYVSWELSEFLGVLGTTKQDGKGVVAFQMKAAFSTDPPELAPDRIARRRLRGQPAPGPRAGLAERLSGDPGTASRWGSPLGRTSSTSLTTTGVQRWTPTSCRQ